MTCLAKKFLSFIHKNQKCFLIHHKILENYQKKKGKTRRILEGNSSLVAAAAYHGDFLDGRCQDAVSEFKTQPAGGQCIDLDDVAAPCAA